MTTMAVQKRQLLLDSAWVAGALLARARELLGHAGREVDDATC